MQIGTLSTSSNYVYIYILKCMSWDMRDEVNSLLLIRPAFLQWKGVPTRWVGLSWEGQFSNCFTISVNLISGLIRGTAYGGSDLQRWKISSYMSDQLISLFF